MMRTHRLPFVLLVLGAMGCSSDAPATDPVTAYVGATIITGDGSDPISDGVILVQGSSITAAGASSDIDVPAGATTVDLTGRYVMPALVNAHLHLSSDAAERASQLRHMAYYGASAVVSLGLDMPGAPDGRSTEVPDGARWMSAGQGITAPEPGRSEVPNWVTTEEEARVAVQDLASQNVDIVKIWVDDRGGQYTRLSPELYGAVIDEAHANDIPVTAHIFRLEDAKGLLRAGIDAFAHGIRDMDLDQELLDLWLERPDVVLVPNLPGTGFPYEIDWVGTVTEEQMVGLQEAAARSREAAQESYGIQARNLARLSEAGVRISFGTDGSTAWAVHLEMEDMVRAGMTPMQVITAATSTSADFTGFDDTGMIAAGRSADFIVLEADPLSDIRNTRGIVDVYLRGAAIDRAGIAAEQRGMTAQQ